MNIKNIAENLDKVINEYLEKEAVIPGLAVGVVYNNETIYTKGFGVKNINSKEPIDENTLFHMASVSKTFVAAGIMQLVEQGKIKLDSFLIEYLPYFELNDDRYKKVTIRQLLNHISGMPDEDDYEWYKPQYDDGALERYVRSIKNRSLMWNPAEKFAYSNIAFEVLGDVIAKVSDMSFEEYMKTNILDVLDMMKSNFYKPLVSKELLASPHVLDVKDGYGPVVSEVFPYNRAHGPSSTLYSNVKEMCNYAIANLNRGYFEENKILETSSYDEMWRIQAATGRLAPHLASVGLAWFLGEYKGSKFYSHSGMDTGFKSYLILLPEKNIAIVTMTNCDYADIEGICSNLLNAVLEEDNGNVKVTLAHHLAKILFSKGMEAALQEYSTIKKGSIGNYFGSEAFFSQAAESLLERKRVKEAIEMLQLSKEIFPESWSIYYDLGNTYLHARNKVQAIECFKKSLELNPHNEDCKRVIENMEQS